MRKITTIITRSALGIIAVLIIWFAIHTIVITIDGLVDSTENTADVIVILGNKVEETGLPSDRLAARLDRGAELFNNQKSTRILVSGGIGETGFSESEAMKDYLINAGIPQDAIFEDSSGINTAATAENTKHFLEENELTDVIIVSQFYHITRTRCAFKKKEVAIVGSAHARFFEDRDLYSVIREFPAFYKYLLDFK